MAGPLPRRYCAPGGAVLGRIDVALIAAYLAYSVWAGWSSRERAGRSLEEYFLAGRALPGWMAGLSMAATQFAADTPLVVTGLLATGGVFTLWQLWVYAVAFLLLALVLGPSWRRAGVLTDAQLTELRYGGREAAVLRAAKAVYFGLVFNGVVLAMVLLAACRITEPFLRWDLWLPVSFYTPLRAGVHALGLALGAGILSDPWTASTNNLLSVGAVVAVTATYSATGGLRAVVRTDLLQLAIALIASAGYAWAVLDRVGGRAGLAEGLQTALGAATSGHLALTPDRAVAATAPFLALLSVQWLCQINADGSGYLAQRVMACRSDADVRTAGLVFVGVQILLRSWLWLPIGLGLLLVFPGAGTPGDPTAAAAREATFVRGIAELLPPGLLGLALVGLLAAFASTLDTHLNWGSSYLTNDLGRRFVAPALGLTVSDRAWVWLARLGNLLVLGVALATVPFLDSIQAAWRASLLLGAGVGALLVARWFWWRINAAAELAALAASALLAPLALLMVSDDALRLVLVATGATTAGVTVALLTAPEDRDHLAAFYARARPPGFWGPFAHEPRTERARLASGLLATALAAAAVFALLVAGATWLVGAPPPLGWSTGPWLGALLACAAAAAGLAAGLSARAAPRDQPG